MRDDFPRNVKMSLAHRVGFICSNPDCRKTTSGPSGESNSQHINIGVAAHICAASEGGPRYDGSLSSEERASINNGIWLCQNCATMIDRDTNLYTKDFLLEWKYTAEERARAGLSGNFLENNELLKHTQIYNHFLNGNNLPPRNIDFTGRENELDTIWKHFSENRDKSIITQTICGLGGVGKTQLAIEYAYRHFECYSNIWWINAADQITFDKSAQEFAKIIRLQENCDDIQNILLNWFETHENWLLIFDNVEDISNIDNYINISSISGNILITSLKPLDRGTEILLDVFPVPDAISFLVSRTNIDDNAGAKKIAERLGYFPLALEQTAAFIRQKGESYAGYMRRIEKRGLHLLDNSTPHYYNKVVTTTWLISFKELSLSAQKLLYICAYYAPDSIPIYIIENNKQILPKDLHDSDYDELVDELIQYSLVSRTITGISIHMLVQEVIREQLMHNKMTEYVWYSFNISFNTITLKTIETANITAIKHFGNHAFHAAMNFIESNEIDEEYRAKPFLITLGRNFIFAGMYSYAKKSISFAIESFAQTFGNNHILVYIAMSYLAQVHFKLGEYKAALDLYNIVIPKLEGCTDEANESYQSFVSSVYYDISLVYLKLADFNQAYKYIQKSSSQISKNDILGGINLRLGNDTLALEQFQNNINYLENDTALNSVDIARLNLSVAQAQCSQRNFPEAIENYKQGITVLKDHLGKDHPEIAHAICGYARILGEQREYNAAISEYNKALEIYEKTLAQDHTLIILARIHLAVMHMAKKDYDIAYNSLLNLLPKMIKAFGSDNLETNYVYSYLAIAAFDLGKNDEALDYAKKADTILKSVLGEEHLDVVHNSSVLARILIVLEKYDEALDIYKSTISVLEEKTLANKLLLADIANVAYLYARQENYIEAMKYYQKAYHLSIEIYGTIHHQTVLFEKNINFITNKIKSKSFGNSLHTSLNPKTGRNELCPCGSGKKYKKCCGVTEI